MSKRGVKVVSIDGDSWTSIKAALRLVKRGISAHRRHDTAASGSDHPTRCLGARSFRTRPRFLGSGTAIAARRNGPGASGPARNLIRSTLTDRHQVGNL